MVKPTDNPKAFGDLLKPQPEVMKHINTPKIDGVDLDKIFMDEAPQPPASPRPAQTTPQQSISNDKGEEPKK